MRLKYLNFLLTFNFVFAKQQILNLAAYGSEFYTAAISFFIYTKSGWLVPSAFKAFRIKLIKVKIRK